MKSKKLFWAILAIVLVGLVFAFLPYVLHDTYEVTHAEEKQPVAPNLTPQQVIWLAHLMDCESGIYAGAINPNDLDNTPSYGILQFKESTFETFAVKYGITDTLMTPEAQVLIVMRWLTEPGTVQWEQQFPACVAKFGLPPQ